MTTQPDSERRRAQRIPLSLPCTIQDQDGHQEPFELVDLSESGVRIRCGHAISPMTRIRVSMALPGDSTARFDTDGVVVWSHATEDGQFDTGVFFSDLGDTEREALKTLVHAAD